MKLGWKIFASYLLVLVVSGLVLIVSTSYAAPTAFAQHVRQMGWMVEMEDAEAQEMMSQGQGQGQQHRHGSGGTRSQQLVADLEENFRQTLNTALLRSALAATLTTVILSLFVSQRITQPIRQLVKASHRIASGHYGEHLVIKSHDELGELTQSFNSMAAKLAETETLRLQLIADVSHELKTPLASITGYMVGLQDGVIPATDETFQKVQREADRLQRLVHDLQELSRAEAGQLPMKVQPCDAGQLIHDTVEWIRPQFEDRGVLLNVEVPSECIQVRCDYDRVRQVILNLLGNALQYTPEGGRVTITLTNGEGVAAFKVVDTGMGIAQENLERIFQRFYRVDKSRSRASGGSGIGLTIASHIVRSLGGRIWAESDGIGKGSTFCFTLPLA
jgi:histidine kinase